MSRKGKASRIRYNSNRILPEHGFNFNHMINPKHIEKMIERENEKQRPPIIKRKTS